MVNKMGVFKEFYRRRQEKELEKELNQVLENDIFKLLNHAEFLLNINPKKGIELFRQADSLYLWKGYDFKTECRVNDVCFSYMKKYPSVCFPNLNSPNCLE